MPAGLGKFWQNRVAVGLQTITLQNYQQLVTPCSPDMQVLHGTCSCGLKQHKTCKSQWAQNSVPTYHQAHAKAQMAASGEREHVLWACGIRQPPLRLERLAQVVLEVHVGWQPTSGAVFAIPKHRIDRVQAVNLHDTTSL